LTARPPPLQSSLGKGSCCATLIEILGMLGGRGCRGSAGHTDH
jgi:hypothetical protein